VSQPLQSLEKHFSLHAINQGKKLGIAGKLSVILNTNLGVIFMQVQVYERILLSNRISADYCTLISHTIIG
jgi:hypothetical protein